MNYKTRLFFLVAAIAVSAIPAIRLIGQAPNPHFNPASGNGPIEVIIPTVIPVIFETVAPGDAPLVLRTTTVLTNAWFDAIAPYHPTAVGVNSRLGNRPENEATDLNRNIAIFHASYHVLNSLYPYHAGLWREMMFNYDLDPDDTSIDLTTAVGIGNRAGAAVVAFRENDGMNQLGNEPLFSRLRGNGQGNVFVQEEGPLVFLRSRYFDQTGYRPVNSGYELTNAARWQPQIVTNEHGIFYVQTLQTPQFAVTSPYSYADPKVFRSPDPVASSLLGNRRSYKQQADEVLQASANMTDRQKIIAELYDNKIRSLGFSALFMTISRGLSLEEFVHYDFLANMAAFDAGIAVWQEKARFDAVRPVTAIAHLYGNQPVHAWGGPGLGTVDDIPANQWQSYLPVAAHQEYPSGSAAFCAAHATASRLFFEDDELNWQIPVPAGSSVIEPGITPAEDIVIEFPTWTDFEMDCGDSRFWAGVHFKDSIVAGRTIGQAIGDLAFSYYLDLVSGSAPLAEKRTIQPDAPSTWR